MRTLILPLIFLISCNSNGSGAYTSDLRSDSALKAEFQHHFRILDSIVLAYPLDTVFTGGISSIQFFEENTGVEAETDGNVLGKIFFSRKDLEKWHQWYNAKYNNGIN